MAFADVPVGDAVQFRALPGQGIQMIISLRGFEIAAVQLDFDEARAMGAGVFELAEAYGGEHPGDGYVEIPATGGREP